MTDLQKWIAPNDLIFIKPEEKLWLESIFERLNGYPTLEQIWKIMDEIWQDFECDTEIMDFRVDKFYSHPVWLLNGLFTEQHEQSLSNRKSFAKWVSEQNPKRVADYGGGFGTLASMIGKICPNTEVDIIEKYPHQLSLERTKNMKNVNHKKNLEGKYDILIATDVFEHVVDPLALVAETGKSLKHGGMYLVANCFYPVILCHLPQTFHFRYTWNRSMEHMGFKVDKNILYGTVFLFKNELNLLAARKIELKSQKLWKLIKNYHRYFQRVLTKILI